MKAVLYTKYGSPDVLEFKDVAQPEPKDHEVLIKIHAAALNASDWRLLRGTPFMVRLSEGLTKPKKQIMGSDLAGRVKAVGRNVTQFQAGDEVFGDLSFSGRGAFAEYVCAPEQMIALKPQNVSFEEAAALPMAAVTALQALRDKGQIQNGQRVLIHGASGGVGTFAVQLAKIFGAHVTAVCSTKKIQLLKSLGADQVIDYTVEDFTQNGQQYDLIIAVNGYHPITAYKRALSSQGRYITIGGTDAQLFQGMLLGPLLSRRGGKNLGVSIAKQSQKDMMWIKKMVEDGRFKPVIDRSYSFKQLPEAIRYLEAGHARGKITILMNENEDK